MEQIANLIVLEVGLWQAKRMNEQRTGMAITREGFIEFNKDRWGAAWFINLMSRLFSPRRLALPDNYDLSERKTLCV